MLYGWLIEERMSVRQILKRLNAGPWLARCGGARWSASVVHRILSDPTYSGTAYANRYHYVPPEKPRARGPKSGENTCRKLRAKEEWIPIPVPPIVDEETRRLAQAQLERNARLSFRNNKKYSYLLRCLLSCESCDLAMFGVTYKATERQPERRYYQCHGKDPIMSAREHKCTQRPAKANELEETVWEHVKELMRDPERLLTQFEQFAHLRRQAQGAREVLEDLQAFCQRIDARLDDATFEEKQAILQLLIERIIVREDTLEIRHIIPLDGPPRNSMGSTAPPGSGLRSDGVNGAPLPRSPLEVPLEGGLQALVIVGDHQLDAS